MSSHERLFLIVKRQSFIFFKVHLKLNTHSIQSFLIKILPTNFNSCHPYLGRFRISAVNLDFSSPQRITRYLTLPTERYVTSFHSIKESVFIMDTQIYPVKLTIIQVYEHIRLTNMYFFPLFLKTNKHLSNWSQRVGTVMIVKPDLLKNKRPLLYT